MKRHAGHERQARPHSGERRRQRKWAPWWEEWGAQWGPPPRAPGRRARRGDIRAALLGVLVEGPAHGYQIINRLEEKSDGMWRPSPGSVYPTLQLFEDEGLVESDEREGKRVYELTDAGRKEASDLAERLGRAPWDPPGGGASATHAGGPRGRKRAGERLGPLIAPLMLAVRQLAMTADSDQFERAASVLKTATKDLYKILSE